MVVIGLGLGIEIGIDVRTRSDLAPPTFIFVPNDEASDEAFVRQKVIGFIGSPASVLRPGARGARVVLPVYFL